MNTRLVDNPGPDAWVRDQMTALARALRLPERPLAGLFDALAPEALALAARGRGRRFSAINADGLPFQWSIAIGKDRFGLRAVTDCGLPGTPIRARVEHTLAALRRLTRDLGWTPGMAEFERVLSPLLPPAAELDATLMGLCVAFGIDPAGTIDLKVYVNQCVGDAGVRYERMAAGLAALGRMQALESLLAVRTTIGTRATPVFAAVDVLPDRVGRIKLYFRPTGACGPELPNEVCERLGCREVSARLAAFRGAFLSAGPYPANALDFSIELPADGAAAGFKEDLEVARFAASDADTDRRLRGLLAALGFDATAYERVRDVIVGAPSTTAARQLLFVGQALRGAESVVNVYFYPLRDAAPR